MKHIKVNHNVIVQTALLDKHGHPCPYCTRKMDVSVVKLMPTNDHIRAKKRFKHERDNRTIVVCSECNYMKGDMTIEEFIVSLLTKNRIFEEAMRLNAERIAHLDYFSKMGLG